MKKVIKVLMGRWLRGFPVDAIHPLPILALEVYGFTADIDSSVSEFQRLVTVRKIGTVHPGLAEHPDDPQSVFSVVVPSF